MLEIIAINIQQVFKQKLEVKLCIKKILKYLNIK